VIKAVVLARMASAIAENQRLRTRYATT